MCIFKNWQGGCNAKYSGAETFTIGERKMMKMTIVLFAGLMLCLSATTAFAAAKRTNVTGKYVVNLVHYEQIRRTAL